ncbi:MAG TPA: hypothetical protein PLA24_10120 [Tenuifilaceae bacterium]|nr:hypothetical protein [Tenuifilaceae bacterium]
MKPILRNTATIALLLIATSTMASNDRLSKTYDREFATPPVTKLVVENKFGQINIENWDKKAISIHVDIKVENSNNEKAKLMLNAITVEFSESDNIASAITKFNDDIMRSNRRLFSSISDDDLSIDYQIKMPASINVDLTNRYGDIFIDKLSGQMMVALKYGNIKVNKLTLGDNEPLNTLTLGYGNASIAEANWLKVDMKYSKLTIDNVQALVLVSKYSKANIGNASSLVFESKYDGYEIDNISKMIGESGYTNFKINKLNTLFKVTAKYGEVKIYSVSSSLKEINFTSSYTEFKAGLPSSLSYKLDADMSYGNVRYPSDIARVNKIEENTSTEVNGIVGNEKEAKTTVKLKMRYGSASLYNN